MTWNLSKTISVPVVSPEKCESLVNGICVIQRNDSASSQTMAVATAMVVLATMSL